MRRFFLGLTLCCSTAVLLAQSGSTRKVIHMGNDPAPPFSRAVAAGDFIYLTGTTGSDPKQANDPAAQANRALDNLAGTQVAFSPPIACFISPTITIRMPPPTPPEAI